MPELEPVGRVRRFLRHPLMLLPVKAVLVVAPLIGGNILIAANHLTHDMAVYLVQPIEVLVALTLFVLYTRRVEGRPVSELTPAPALAETGIGLALGVLAFTLVVGTLAALGAYGVTGHASISIIFAPLVNALVIGVFEELLMRGVLFRIAEDSLGSYWALAISAAFFGIAHLGNPHATLLAAAAIAIEAGIMLAAAYMLTRHLWLPIGIHAGWNFTQGGIFGIAVSGTTSHGLLQATLTGPVWLTGGEFGAESSVLAIAFCGLLGIVVFMRARRLGHVRPPFWRRAPRAVATV